MDNFSVSEKTQPADLIFVVLQSAAVDAVQLNSRKNYRLLAETAVMVPEVGLEPI